MTRLSKHPRCAIDIGIVDASDIEFCRERCYVCQDQFASPERGRVLRGSRNDDGGSKKGRSGGTHGTRALWFTAGRRRAGRTPPPDYNFKLGRLVPVATFSAESVSSNSSSRMSPLGFSRGLACIRTIEVRLDLILIDQLFQ